MRKGLLIKTLSLAIGASVFLPWQKAQASLEVDFIESAPKDQFVVKNSGACARQNFLLKIDLTKSAGGLLFDTTATGAGLDVFQPFESEAEDVELASSDSVKDGDTTLSVRIKGLASGKAVSFTIDVDDTLPSGELGQTRVADSEIEGASVKVTLEATAPVTAVFDRGSKAIVILPLCARQGALEQH